MYSRKLMSEYFKEDGSTAMVYLVVNETYKRDAFYSITYRDKDGSRIGEEDFHSKSLYFVEDAAENWSLGIKQVLFG
jgi:hypothetical protein